MEEMCLARDRDGRICLYIGEAPYKTLHFSFWLRDKIGEVCLLKRDSFPEVKWSDSEPTKVKLGIVK